MSNDWSKAEHHAERAHEYFQAGQWDKALTELKAALAVNPDQSDWHFGMGLTLDALRRYDEAIKSFQEVLRLRGDDIETMLYLSVDLIRSFRLQQAIELLEKVNRLDPACESGYCYRIAAYAQMGQHEQAELMFYLARQVTDECPLCFHHLALSLTARGQYDQAIWCWNQSLRLAPDFSDARIKLAGVHRLRDQPDKARQLYLQQLRDEPGDIDTLLQLGNLLVEMGQTAEAAEKFRRVLELDPSVPDAHLHLGELAMETAHLDAAEAELEMALRLAPDRPAIHLRLAQVAHQRKQAEQARRHIQAELERSNHQPAHALDLSQLLLERREPEPAIELMDQLLNRQTWPELNAFTRSLALRYRAVAWVLLGRLDKSIADGRACLRLNPRDNLAMHNLVLAYIQQRRFARAWFWFTRAKQIQPDSPDWKPLRKQLRLSQWKHRLERLGRFFLPRSRQHLLEARTFGGVPGQSCMSGPARTYRPIEVMNIPGLPGQDG